MPVDTSEKDLEAAIESVLVSEAKGTSAEPDAPYDVGGYTPGGYRKRSPADYNRARCLIPGDLFDFVVATQPSEWQKLKKQFGTDAKDRFVQKVYQEIEKRGTLNVLRRGVRIHGARFKLVYFKPSTARNPDLQEKYRANVFTVVRQLPYSTDSEHTLDLGLFLNGLPIFTAELKNPLTGQTYRDAIHQYRSARDPREPFFQFGRCLAHFAVGSEEVYMTTHLRGDDTYFLPFNQGYDGGAGNPPNARGPRTSYLWMHVWARDSILNLIQHFIATIDRLDDDGTPTGEKILIFPRYHQMRSVRRLVADARTNGAGQRYLIQHSAGSGKSISIAVLAHQLAFLNDADDQSVFDTVIVVTDRRVLDKQIAQVILQFEQERGVVADVKEGASGLGKALKEGKRIVIVTLQTFPHVAEAIRKRRGHRFAVIIDEAHSSQTGEYRKHLNDTLSAPSLEAAEAQDATDSDLEDKIAAEIQKRGHQPNVSNFAFTATPKSKTLELFGDKQPDGSYAPFDLYSMRQAIDEGFILDVLQNYTTYTDYWNLLKQIDEDPAYDSKKASRLLQSFVSRHEHTIGKKTEIMVQHFAEKVAHRIGGQAKAMIVTRSRLHAVRFKVAFDRYLQEEGYPYKALVAFSGTVEDKGIEHTERSMNGFSESQTRHVFDRDAYRFLIVANKYQTGFDQPLLHTMYVDKKLGGVNAVQTLSRLNRTHPQKNETMVLDFANEAEAIREAFQPYYERTTLQEGTDPGLLYDLEHQIREHGIVTDRDLDDFAGIWFSGTGTQKQLHSVLDRCVDRYEHATEEEQYDVRQHLGTFVRLYAFLAQVVPFEDVELEKLYVLAKPLLSKLIARLDPSDIPRELLQYVDIDSYRIQEAHTGGMELPQGQKPLPPQKESDGRASATEPEKEPLSRILEALNERFGYDFDEDDRIFIEQLQRNVRGSDAVRKSIEVNSESDARLTFDAVAEDELQEMIDKNFKLYKKIVDNDAFGRLLFDFLFDRTLEAMQAQATDV
ncbi:type I restriction endonuclease subunit R [Salisaeta longa]|uniref:type I restriction endonuclease subunit R n=1 Tax=Salisaeta longa TaxID=503170 RepID=UPI0003B3EF1B|nr:type I restriction endonuclease [Salisaeta longa]